MIRPNFVGVGWVLFSVEINKLTCDYNYIFFCMSISFIGAVVVLPFSLIDIIKATELLFQILKVRPSNIQKDTYLQPSIAVILK